VLSDLCIERFFRTLKEQLLWVRRFRDLEDCVPPSSSSEVAITTTGLWSAYAIGRQLRHVVIFNLNWGLRRDSIAPIYTLCAVHPVWSENWIYMKMRYFVLRLGGRDNRF
jgi:hypothetical protein